VETPRFLADTKYNNSSDVVHSPFQIGHKTVLPAFIWATQKPYIMANFHSVLGSLLSMIRQIPGLIFTTFQNTVGALVLQMWSLLTSGAASISNVLCSSRCTLSALREINTIRVLIHSIGTNQDEGHS
jgi:hypothetical protein